MGQEPGDRRQADQRPGGVGGGRPAYQRAFRKRRCIIPADAFYEWKAPTFRRSAVAAPRVPHAVRRRDGEPLAFAGLWEIWRDPSVTGDNDPDAWVRTCAIVTTRANDLLAPSTSGCRSCSPRTHGTRGSIPSVGDVASLERLLAPAADEWFTGYAVSTRVNKPDNNDADLLEPASP